MLFIDAFIQNNRLDHVTQVMGYHPDYLDCFLRTQQYLLRGDGPLPYHYRHYIAIMVREPVLCNVRDKNSVSKFSTLRKVYFTHKNNAFSAVFLISESCMSLLKLKKGFSLLRQKLYFFTCTRGSNY